MEMFCILLGKCGNMPFLACGDKLRDGGVKDQHYVVIHV